MFVIGHFLSYFLNEVRIDSEGMNIFPVELCPAFAFCDQSEKSCPGGSSLLASPGSMLRIDPLWMTCRGPHPERVLSSLALE